MSKNAKLWDCVFSTLVEVFLNSTKNQIKAQSLLHARGGVSISFVTFCKFAMSSPRSWRCFYSSFLKSQIHQVFSTLVEVFQLHKLLILLDLCLLHARGGVSNI